MSVITCPKCGAKNRVDQRASTLQPICGKCGALLPTSDNHPIKVTDADFQSVVLSAHLPVLLDCWAPWCGPCRAIAPVMDELAAESAGRYLIAKLNVDENPNTAQRFQIASIPTMLLFKNGELIDRIVGLQPRQALVARLSRL